MFEFDYDSDDFGDMYGFGYDDDDYSDDFAFHLNMMDIDNPYIYDPVLDTSSSADSSSSYSDYVKWEETRMRDSHLLHFSPLIPGVEERDERFQFQLKLSSIDGGDWGRVEKMEEKFGGWLESKMVVGYQDLYNLASQMGSMITAWRGRMKQCHGDWSKEKIRTLLSARKVTRKDASGEFEDEEQDWWFTQFLGAKEIEISVEDRMRYSVGRGMLVFGSLDTLAQLDREIYGVKNLVQKFLIRVLSSSLPVALPYPVLLCLSKLICSSGGGTKVGWAGRERASQLVESKYVNMVYLAVLDIYNVVLEIMFKHAAETISPNFPEKFAFLRSTLARNLALLESFHQLTGHEEPQGEKVHYQVLKEMEFKIETSKLRQIVLQKRFARDRVVVSGDNIFIVNAKGEDMEAGLVLAVHHLKTGEVIKQFTAIAQSLLSGNKYTMCTRLFVLDEFVCLSLSQGYPKASISSRDQVFLVNWVEEKIVMKQTVSHSSQLQDAVKEREDFFNHSDSETDSDYLNTSYDDDDDMVNTSLGVSLTKKADKVFLLHSEVVLPELGCMSEMEDWGQHVKIFGLPKDRLLHELTNVRVLDLHAGLVIYEAAKEKHSNGKKKQVLTKLNDCDVVVKWLDLVTGKEVYQESFVDTLETPRPVYSIARLNEKDTMVLLYKVGEELISLYRVDEAGSVELSQQIALPALTSVGNADQLKMQLQSDGLISFRHRLAIPSVVLRLPVHVTRSVLARAGADKCVAEVFVPRNASVNDVFTYDGTTSSGYHTLAPAETIVQEGNKLLILETKKREFEREWVVSLRQWEFEKPALDVMNYDRCIATEIVEKVEATKRKIEELVVASKSKTEELPTSTNDVLSELAMDGKRLSGSLVNWCGSFGFLRLHGYPLAPNIFIHISEIRKPRPLLTAGVKLEVSLMKDFTKNKVKGVAGRVLDY
eukprot:GFUD01028489.1.p1 GENE.GFUD01028489.1~~GFUD01028489.1.p1  ORF type:complete len:936 (+),score=258.82 GFUD01028489.1:51-2858(+)